MCFLIIHILCDRWRAGFYVVGETGCVENFMYMLDDFIQWKMKSADRYVEVHVCFV